MTPMDLRISLVYLTSAQARRRGIPEIEAHPGFYVEASANEGYVDHVKLTRVTDYLNVERIATEIDHAVGADARPVMQAVRNVRTQHQRDMIARRRAAEAMIEQAESALAAIREEETNA